MQRRLPWALFATLLMAATVLSVIPARADESSTLVLVEPRDKLPEDLLEEADIDRIGELSQDALRFGILSAVSPDDRWLVLATEGGPQLLAIESGERIPLPPIDPDLGLTEPLTAAWRDERTLVLLTGLQDRRNAALAVLSFETGAWSVETLPFPAGALVDMAPNASRVLIALREEQLRFQIFDLNSWQFQDVGQIDLMYQTFTQTSWSQDGSHLAYLVNTLPDRISSRSRDFLDGVLLNSFVGRDVLGRLPAAENPIVQRNEVRIYDFANQTQRVLAARHGDGTVASDLSWSTDGRILMVQMEYPAKLKGRTYPTYTISSRSEFRFYDTELRELSRYPLPDPLAGGEFVSPDELIYQQAAGLNVELMYYNRVSGEVRKLSSSAGSYGLITGIIATRQSRQVIFDFSSYTTPFDLYRMRWDGSALARLTWTTEELRQQANLRQDPVSFKVGKQTFSGVLVQSADAAFPPKNKPIIVWQEGGPLNGVFNTWGARVENPFGLLPNFGFAVLVVPLQGRYGQGGQNLMAMADGNNFGQLDIDTQADIVRQMIARGWTARGKVGLTGCSYGGYFVLQSVVRHPDLYAAGNAQCALYDAITEWNRGYPNLMGLLQQRTVLEDVDEYERDSPFYNTAKIRTPLLIFHGSGDFLPVTIAENFFQTVKDRGVPARMVKFIGTGHGIVPADPSLTPEDLEAYLSYAAQEQIRWFRTYLK